MQTSAAKIVDFVAAYHERWRSFEAPISHSFAVDAELDTTEEHLVFIALDAGKKNAVLETAFVGEFQREYWEYTLANEDRGWEIVVTQQFEHARDATILPPELRDARLGPVVATEHFVALAQNVMRRLDFLFVPDRGVYAQDGEATTARVHTVGTLAIDSGLLGVWNFSSAAYGDDAFVPLSRRVPVGRHAVDVVTTFGMPAAIRVRFSSAHAVAWHPAFTIAGSNTVNSDCRGRDLAVFDAFCFANGHRRMAREIWDGFSNSILTYPCRDSERCVLRGLAHPDDTFLSETPYGGDLPMYWGVDTRGELAALVVDYNVIESDE